MTEQGNMTIHLSTEQLGILSTEGSIRIFKGHTEEFEDIVAETLDISLSELVAGQVAHTPLGTEVRY